MGVSERRARMALTDTKFRNQRAGTKPVKLTDADGLHLEVRSTGKKLWRYRSRIANKENVFAIGEDMSDKSYPEHISLQDARSLRDEARTLVKRGIHPAHKRKAEIKEQLDASKSTFRAVAAAWFADQGCTVITPQCGTLSSFYGETYEQVSIGNCF
jgi:hypothetical protein